jgi:hypothetical protein
MHGVYVADSLSVGNRIAGNQVGVNTAGTIALPNENGVAVHHGACQNRIGPGNMIWHNRFWGVVVFKPETKGNTITRNSISGNGLMGIELVQNSNDGINQPHLELMAGGIQGTAQPDAVVEIFSDTSDQGKIYEGTVTADGNGNFIWTGTPAGPFVTATATNAAGSTSQFSGAVLYTGIRSETDHFPSKYALFQNFPNPFNPETSIRFTVRERGRVQLTVFDRKGRELSVLADAHYPPGDHTVFFDASNLPSGIYLLRFHAGDFRTVRKMVKVQ